MRITIVAFSDKDENSLAYKKFNDIEEAVAFYMKQLAREEVRVISTRKVV